MKATKKIVGATCALVAALALSAGSTFAWLTANKNVSVTGMAVKVSTPSNLLIADASSTVTDSSFKNAFVSSDTTAKILAPVSSITGVSSADKTSGTSSFYYTSNSNVSGSDGSAVNKTFIAMTGNGSEDTKFKSNYTDSSVGYVDYTVALKAYNSADAAQYIVMDSLKLTYSGEGTDNSHAFRVAVLTGAGTAGDSSITFADVTSLAIYSDASAKYLSESDSSTDKKAVDSTSTLGAVTNLNAATNIYTIEGNSTGYVKVVLRLWLEGEDTTCTNTTFAKLTSDWSLDASFTLTTTSASGAVTNLTKETTTIYYNPTAGKAANESTLLDSYIIDGVTYTAYNATAGKDGTATTIYKSGNRYYLIDTTAGYNIVDITDRVDTSNPQA